MPECAHSSVPMPGDLSAVHCAEHAQYHLVKIILFISALQSGQLAGSLQKILASLQLGCSAIEITVLKLIILIRS